MKDLVNNLGQTAIIFRQCCMNTDTNDKNTIQIRHTDIHSLIDRYNIVTSHEYGHGYSYGQDTDTDKKIIVFVQHCSQKEF